MYAEDELLMLSGVQHYTFCPRQWALIHLEQQWQENHLTLEGDYLHSRVDNPECMVLQRGVVTIRAVPLVSYELGICGISDAIELHKTKDKRNAMFNPRYNDYFTPYPVEYKHGCSKEGDEDRLQLCAQAMCLEEMYGITLKKAALYYAETRNREYVIIDDELRLKVKTACTEMHTVFRTLRTPQAFYSSKCRSCSLYEKCVPKIKKGFGSVDNYLKQLCDA